VFGKRIRSRLPCRNSGRTRTVDQSAAMMDGNTDAKFGLFCLSLAF